MFNIAELIIFISSQSKFLPGVHDDDAPPPPDPPPTPLALTLRGLSAGRKITHVWVNNIQPVIESGLMQ